MPEPCAHMWVMRSAVRAWAASSASPSTQSVPGGVARSRAVSSRVSSVGARSSRPASRARSETSSVRPALPGAQRPEQPDTSRGSKNALYARMGRAAEVLLPSIVLIENVPAVQHDRGKVVGLTTDQLSSLGYRVAARTLRLQTFGVAQTRRRHVLLATKLSDVDPVTLLDRLGSRESTAAVDLEWAIGDLEDVLATTGYDAPPRANKVNAARMEYLLQEDLYDLPNELRPKCHQNEHSYKSMYGRLRWNLPAQTITSPGLSRAAVIAGSDT